MRYFVSILQQQQKGDNMTNQASPSNHTDESVLIARMEAVQKQIQPGEIWHHYKDPSKLYKIIDLDFLEATEEVAVVYQSLYGNQLVWVRSWAIWSEQVEYQGVLCPRFKKF